MCTAENSKYGMHTEEARGTFVSKLVQVASKRVLLGGHFSGRDVRLRAKIHGSEASCERKPK